MSGRSLVAGGGGGDVSQWQSRDPFPLEDATRNGNGCALEIPIKGIAIAAARALSATAGQFGTSASVKEKKIQPTNNGTRVHS